MCDPVSALIAGTVISAGGQMMGGITAYQQGNANAKALNSQAKLREEKGKFDAEMADREFRRQAGVVRARVGSTGIEATSFSDIFADDAAEAALKKKAIKFGATVDANNLRFQASAEKSRGTSALVSGFIGAAGSVASGTYRITRGVSLDNNFSG